MIVLGLMEEFIGAEMSFYMHYLLTRTETPLAVSHLALYHNNYIFLHHE